MADDKVAARPLPDFNEYLLKAKSVFLDPKAVSTSEMLADLDKGSDKEGFTTAPITDTLTPFVPPTPACNIGNDVFNDVEFFKCFTEKNTSTVFDVINQCSLRGGKEALKKILEVPIQDISTIQVRQEALRSMEASPASFEAVKGLERDVLWVFEEQDQNLKDLYDMVFFKFCLLRPLNRHPAAITTSNLYRIVASPFVGILSPLMYVIVPYLIVMYKLKIKIPIKAYLKLMLSTVMSGDIFSISMGGIGGGRSSSTVFKALSFVFTIIFYFQGIFNSVEISKTLYKISRHLVEKVNNIVGFLRHAHTTNLSHWGPGVREAFLGSKDILTLEEDAKYIDTLDAQPFGLTKNFGKQLHIYLALNKDVIRSVLLKSYIIDALGSITGFKYRVGGCYTALEVADVPKISFHGSFHPCLDPSRVVKNDVVLSGNAILTGPNAGGKSTFVKSLLINTLLSQTVGICAADSATMTPFYIINSQINIPDSKGYESLFEAEMYRCKEKLDLLKKYSTQSDKGGHALFVMDEIFNSTNPVEGIAGAYAIAKKIAEYPRCILMFTTHYTYLTKLKKTGRFTNYKMNVERGEDGSISYPYKLVGGVSKQYIALDLLAKNGFDSDIISEAIEIKNRLVAPRV